MPRDAFRHDLRVLPDAAVAGQGSRTTRRPRTRSACPARQGARRLPLLTSGDRRRQAWPEPSPGMMGLARVLAQRDGRRRESRLRLRAGMAGASASVDLSGVAPSPPAYPGERLRACRAEIRVSRLGWGVGFNVALYMTRWRGSGASHRQRTITRCTGFVAHFCGRVQSRLEGYWRQRLHRWPGSSQRIRPDSEANHIQTQ